MAQRSLLLLLLPGLLAAAAESELDLDGRWAFEADPDGVGVAQRWFDAAAKPRLAMRMAVPGAWQSFADGARGVGAETPLLRAQFSGVGWYRRLVDLRDLDDTWTRVKIRVRVERARSRVPVRAGASRLGVR